MKFIALVLSLIVLTLSIVPCCSLENGTPPGSQISKAKEDHKCNEKNGDCCKDCSPFYVCGTCTGFTLTNEPVFTFITHLKIVQHSTVYISVELSPASATIWQPPKLS